MKTTYTHKNGNTYNVRIDRNVVYLESNLSHICPMQITVENFSKLVNIEDFLPKTKKEGSRFEYVYIPYSGPNKNGIEWLITKEGSKRGYINGKQIIEVIRKGNNKNSSGGSSSVGYQLGNDSSTRQKTLKKLIEVYSN